MSGVRTTEDISQVTPRRGRARRLSIDELRGSATVLDGVRIAVLFGCFVVLLALIDRVSELRPRDVAAPFLLGKTATTKPVEFAAVVIVALGMYGKGRARGHNWEAIEHGRWLRALATPAIVLMVWRHGLYGYNYLAEEWHALDRILVVGLGLASVRRPAFLIAFVAQCAIVGEQFVTAFGLTLSENVDAVPLQFLLAIGVGFLVYRATGRTETAPIVLLISGLLAAHYFHPGIAKLPLDWLDNDIANFARSAYVVGWQGAGDGGFADTTAGVMERLQTPILVATFVLEVGALLAVAHYRLLRLWLPGWIGFHAAIFLVSGFWLVEWAVMDAALLALLTRPGARDWLRSNTQPIRILAVVTLVLAAPVLLGPPELAWIDTEVVQSVRVEVIDDQGTTFDLSLTELEPFAGQVSFLFASVDNRQPVVAAYGSAFNRQRAAELAAIDSWEDFDALQAEKPPPDPAKRAQAEQLYINYVEHVNDRGNSWWSFLQPPPRTWTSAPTPYDHQHPIVELRVYRVDAVHDLDLRREVLTLNVVVGADGRASVQTLES